MINGLTWIRFKYITLAGLFMLSGWLTWVPAAQPSSKESSPAQDPNSVANQISSISESGSSETSVEGQLESILQSPVSASGKRLYWEPIYHPQITPHTFECLSYPYYPGGCIYTDPQCDPLHRMTLKGDMLIGTDPNQTAIPPEQQTLIQAQGQCCDMIHHWRQINESSAVALEVIRTAQLTQAGSSIYNHKPELAVEAKRTLGLIASKNRNFDCSSRMMFRQLALGNPDKAILLEMEKQLIDLESLLNRLAEQNDAVSVCLGIGKIDRLSPRVIFEDKVDYSSYVRTNPGKR